MRKLLAAAATSLAAAMMLSACGSQPAGNDSAKVVVGASPVPHARILEYVRDNLAADAGIELEIKQYQDYVQPNEGLASGDLDANYFQHLPYLESEIATKKYQFDHGKGIHVEPFGAFSSKYDSIDKLPDGAKIAITNDASNQVRGLKMLEEAGLLKNIADDSNALGLTGEQNPRGFQFAENQPEVIVQQIEDPAVDLAFVNGNFILDAGLKSEDALLVEKVKDNPYANLLVWRKDNKNEGVAKLDELLHSDEVKKFIKETWPAGNVVPAE